jgi:6-phosphogluconolactonase
MRIYIGSYTGGSASEGIYRCELDPQDGALADPTLAHQADSPAFVVANSTATVLYATNNQAAPGGPPQPELRAYAIDRGDSTLTLLGRQSVEVEGPCHISLEANGRAAFAACYGGGGIAMLPLDANGNLQPAVVVRHQGSSDHPERQLSPHPHSANISADGRYLLVPDLGIDQILVYAVSYEPAGLEQVGSLATARQAGPRHLAFHTGADFAYVMGEMDSTITTLAFDAGTGKLAALQTLSTLPKDYTGESATADVHVHPNGRFVYSSNRGHDSISIFAVDASTGELRLTGLQSTQGKTPRGFQLSPDGRWLLAANEESDSLYSYAVDADTGELTPTGAGVSTPSPSCLAFAL